MITKIQVVLENPGSLLFPSWPESSFLNCKNTPLRPIVVKSTQIRGVTCKILLKGFEDEQKNTAYSRLLGYYLQTSKKGFGTINSNRNCTALKQNCRSESLSHPPPLLRAKILGLIGPHRSPLAHPTPPKKARVEWWMDGCPSLQYFSKKIEEFFSWEI